MKVLHLWVLVCFWAMKVVVRIGRWSDESCLRVVQLVLFVRWEGRIVRSGEVLCCLCWWVGRGSLVGVLSFIIESVESLMIEFIVIPLWSFVGECHVWWWALKKSPVIILWSMFSSRLKRVVVVMSSMSVVEDLGVYNSWWYGEGACDKSSYDRFCVVDVGEIDFIELYVVMHVCY